MVTLTKQEVSIIADAIGLLPTHQGFQAFSVLINATNKSELKNKEIQKEQQKNQKDENVSK